MFCRSCEWQKAELLHGSLMCGLPALQNLARICRSLIARGKRNSRDFDCFKDSRPTLSAPLNAAKIPPASMSAHSAELTAAHIATIGDA
jgi:hypothetical protein